MKRKGFGAGEIPQQIKALVTKSDDPSPAQKPQGKIYKERTNSGGWTLTSTHVL